MYMPIAGAQKTAQKLDSFKIKRGFSSIVGSFAQQVPGALCALREKVFFLPCNAVTKESCFSEEYLLPGMKVKEHRL
jgi:hypothetical protein